MKNAGLFSFVAMLLSSPDATASYQMFCELSGTILSTPVQSQDVEFLFRVDSAREIEVEILGGGAEDCQTFVGTTVTVALEQEDAGNLEELVQGAKVLLERYDVDVFLTDTGAAFRSVKYVRNDL